MQLFCVYTNIHTYVLTHKGENINTFYKKKNKKKTDSEFQGKTAVIYWRLSYNIFILPSCFVLELLMQINFLKPFLESIFVSQNYITAIIISLHLKIKNILKIWVKQKKKKNSKNESSTPISWDSSVLQIAHLTQIQSVRVCVAHSFFFEPGAILFFFATFFLFRIWWKQKLFLPIYPTYIYLQI